MKKIILTYGLIAGTIVIASGILGIELVDVGETEAMANLEYVGYLVMLVALSVIFIGIKKYRDQELGGVITFGTAALVGLREAARVSGDNDTLTSANKRLATTLRDQESAYRARRS